MTEGLKHHPTYVAARMMLGRTYQNAGKITESKREFEEVVRLHPQNVLAYKKLAALYQLEGKLNEAAKVCNQGLAIDPYDKGMKQVLALVEEEISYEEERELPFFSDSTASVSVPPRVAIPSPAAVIRTSAFPPIDFDSLAIAPSMSEEVTQPIADDLPENTSFQIRDIENAPFEMEPVAVLPDLTFPELELESPIISDVKDLEEEQTLPPLAFVSQTAYNRRSLHIVRLNAWLVSIQKKGVVR